MPRPFSDGARLPEDAFPKARQIQDDGTLGPVMRVIRSRWRGRQRMLELASNGMRVEAPVGLVVFVGEDDRPFRDAKT